MVAIPTWSWITAAAIFLIGFFIFLFLIFKAYRKHRAIKHYEEIRDKLTLREPEVQEFSESFPSFDLGNVIGGFIVLLVGFTLLPPLTNQVSLTQSSSNVTGAADTLVGLTTLFFALGIATAAVTMVATGFRKSGLI